MDSNFGGWLCGLVVGATTFGVLTVQSYNYFTNYPKDKISIKIRVSLLLVLQAFYIPCFGYSLYRSFASSFTHVLVDLSDPVRWLFGTYVDVDVVSSFIVQTFFAQRIYDLSESAPLSIFVVALVLAQCGAGLAMAVKIILSAINGGLEITYTHLGLVWLVLQVASDIAIAVSSVCLLQGKRTGFKTTDTVINRLVLYSVGTGAMTCVVVIVIASGYAGHHVPFLVNILLVPLGGFYAVAMLAHLNSRQQLWEKARVTGSKTDIYIHTIHITHPPPVTQCEESGVSVESGATTVGRSSDSTVV